MAADHRRIEPITDRKHFDQLMVKGVETLTSTEVMNIKVVIVLAHSTVTSDKLFQFHLFILSTCKQQYLI